MQYTVTGKNDRHFELTDERGEMAGSIDFERWRPTKAQITAKDNVVFDLKPTGFWRNAIEITSNGMSYAKIKPNWRGGLVLNFENGMSFIFMRKGMLTSSYVIVDAEDQVLAEVQSNFQLAKFNFNYTIEMSAVPDEVAPVIPLLLMYCVRYTRMRRAAAAG